MTKTPQDQSPYVHLHFDREVYVQIWSDATFPAVKHSHFIGTIRDKLWCHDRNNPHVLKLEISPGGFNYIDLQASGIVILNSPQRNEVLFDSRTPDCRKAEKV